MTSATRSGRPLADVDAQRTWTLAEANAALPEAVQRIEQVAEMRRDLVAIVRDLNLAGESDLGGVPEAKALEARIDDAMTWFAATGIQVKSIAPALLDFPALTADGPTLLCWLEGEDAIAFHHDPLLGFAGREPVDGIRWPGSA